MKQTAILLASFFSVTAAFTVTQRKNVVPQPTLSTNTVVHPFNKKSQLLFAGGFEWEDPAETFDQGVDNPFENKQLNVLTDSNLSNEGGDEKEGESLQVDPARLLSPRLNGSNLYLIGMMGSGKSAVGDIIARRKFPKLFVTKQKRNCFISK
jgi:hypothetical protein